MEACLTAAANGAPISGRANRTPPRRTPQRQPKTAPKNRAIPDKAAIAATASIPATTFQRPAPSRMPLAKRHIPVLCLFSDFWVNSPDRMELGRSVLKALCKGMAQIAREGLEKAAKAQWTLAQPGWHPAYRYRPRTLCPAGPDNRTESLSS